RRETTPILQDQRFFSENAAQVNFHAAVTGSDVVFIDCRSRSGWQFLDKISGGTHPKPGNILLAISIDRVRTDFFGSRNVGTGHDHFLDSNARLAGGLWRRRELLRERHEDGTKATCCDRKAPTGSGRIHCRELL